MSTPDFGDDPKARAKAEKAYRKAQRPFWKKKRVLIPAGLLALVVASTAAGGDGDTNPTDPVAAPTAEATNEAPATQAPATQAPAPAAPAPAAPAPAAPAPAAPAGLSDGSFTATEPTNLQSQFGTCQATGRVTNTSDSEKTAIVTYTLLRDGQPVGTLQGAANAVGAGQTATVQVLSTSECPSAPFTVEFQVDSEF